MCCLRSWLAIVIATEENFKKNRSFLQDDGVINSINIVIDLDSIYIFPFASYGSFSMEERNIFVIKFNPFVTGLLELVNFPLEEGVVVISLRFLFEVNMKRRLNYVYLDMDHI